MAQRRRLLAERGLRRIKARLLKLRLDLEIKLVKQRLHLEDEAYNDME